MENKEETRYRTTFNLTRSTRSYLLVCISLVLVMAACAPGGTETGDTTSQDQTTEGDQVDTQDQQPDVAEPPTPTPTPTETPWIEGSVVRAPYDPAAGLGPPDVHDDFSRNNPEFELDNTGGLAHGWYADGRFNITFPSRGWWTWYSGATAVTNFYADVVVYNGDQCVDRDAAGLIYRYVQFLDLAFLFGVSCDGGYFSGISGGLGATGPVCMFLDSTPTGSGDLDCSLLWEHPASEFIDAGPGAANRVGVRAINSQVTLYINGHQVDTVDLPASLVYAGNFALYLGSAQSDNASASFDDLSIWFNP
jgi:hypothetical protein